MIIAKKMRIEAIKRYRITESLSKLIEESFAASATIMLVI